MKNHPSYTNTGYYHIQQFENDVVIRRVSEFYTVRTKSSTHKNDNGKRGKAGYSKRSGRRLQFNIRNSPHEFKQFLTLTYPREFPKDGAVVKKHLNTFLTHLRQKIPGIHYVWVIEQQKRGAAHFHILVDQALDGIERRYNRNTPKGRKKGIEVRSEKWSKTWSRITGNKDNERHLKHGLRIDVVTNPNNKALASYFAKYYAKAEQKAFTPDFSNIGRYWGCSRDFCPPVWQGLYEEGSLKWMVKQCHHYGYLNQDRVGAKRFRYSADTGNTIWGLAEVFRQGAESKFSKVIAERLKKPFLGLEEPMVVELDGGKKGNRINMIEYPLKESILAKLSTHNLSTHCLLRGHGQ